jgi:hypothetical protein
MTSQAQRSSGSTSSALSTRILQSIYGRSVRWFRSRYNCGPTDSVIDFEYNTKGLLVGLIGDPPEMRDTNVVLGGVCIDHCDGALRRMTYQVVADCWSSLQTAKYLRSPCLILLMDYEEALCRGMEYLQTWMGIGDFMAALILELARGLAVGVRVVRTSTPGTRDVIEGAVSRYPELTRTETLANLFRVDYFGERRYLAPERMPSFQRSIAAFMPDTTSELLGRHVDRLVVAMNLQQARVFTRARDIYYSHSGNSIAMTQIVFTPTVSLSGKQRMSRSHDCHKLFLGETSRAISEKLGSASKVARDYWTAIVPDVVRAGKEGRSVAEVLHGAVAESKLGPFEKPADS